MSTATTPLAPSLELVAETDAHEGPVYVADEHALYFTSVPAGRVAIRRLDLATGVVRTLVDDANMANGMALHPDGRLVVCEQGTLEEPARISLVDRRTGRRTTVTEAAGRRALNSPNDVVVGRDGSIWFTDPSYGWLQGFRPPPQGCDCVFRHDAMSRETHAISTSFDKPNGLAFSPGADLLYVGDSGAIHAPEDYDPSRPRRVTALDLTGRRPASRVVVDDIPGFPDGLKVDRCGRLWISCAEGVRIHGPEGALRGRIDLPGVVNFTFGGPEQDVLYITADTAVWAAALPDRFPH